MLKYTNQQLQIDDNIRFQLSPMQGFKIAKVDQLAAEFAGIELAEKR
jgi:hypothetical protein